MHDIRILACKQNKLEIKQNINKITYLCICFSWCPSQFRVVVHDWIQGVADPGCRSEEQAFANCLCKCLCGQVWFTPLSVTEDKSKNLQIFSPLSCHTLSDSFGLWTSIVCLNVGHESVYQSWCWLLSLHFCCSCTASGKEFEHLQFRLQLIICDYFVTCHCSVAYRINYIIKFKAALFLCLCQSMWDMLLGKKKS